MNQSPEQRKRLNRPFLWLILQLHCLSWFLLAKVGTAPIDKEPQTAQTIAKNQTNKPNSTSATSLTTSESQAPSKAEAATLKAQDCDSETHKIKTRPTNASMANPRTKLKSKKCPSVGPEANCPLGIPTRAKITIGGKNGERFIKGKLPWSTQYHI